jgi:hypothetical protein
VRFTQILAHKFIADGFLAEDGSGLESLRPDGPNLGDSSGYLIVPVRQGLCLSRLIQACVGPLVL